MDSFSKMQFLEECKTVLPHPAYIILKTVLIAFKMGVTSEEDADQSILYILSPYTKLMEDYNEVMKNSACRNKHMACATVADDVSSYFEVIDEQRSM